MFSNSEVYVVRTVVLLFRCAHSLSALRLCLLVCLLGHCSSAHRAWDFPPGVRRLDPHLLSGKSKYSFLDVRVILIGCV